MEKTNRRIDLNSVLIGSDPEFPLIRKSDRKFISAEGIIGGSKEKPFFISKDGHAVQEDGVMLECTFPPANDPYTFKDNLDHVLNYIRNKHKDLEISFNPAVEFDSEFLQTRQATEVGCSADFDVWECSLADVPNYRKTNLRYSGGHLHVGYPDPDVETSDELVKALDVYLGVPSVLIDTDTLRKKLYGSAGRFRPKPYGIEYRSMSNYWLRDLQTIRWVFGNTKEAILFLNNGFRIAAEDKKWIQQCMKNNDKELAESIIASYEITVPETLLELV